MRTFVAAGLLLAIPLVACGDDSGDASISEPTAAGGAVIDPGDDGDYSVEIDPAEFTSRVDNRFSPMLPGTRWVYEESTADGEVETITIEVLDERRLVMGVETIVVHDVVSDGAGEMIEDTYDWFAQDADGNVWYFGEDTTAYEDGEPSDAGAWEAGVDGAQPGIIMPADPIVSDQGYRQEYLAGEAEDMAQIIAVVPGAVVTRDWTPLEPAVVEEKTYVVGIGFVHETKTEGEDAGIEAVLVEYTTP